MLPQAPAVASTPPGPAVSIPNYLWQAIVCTICCCVPLGIPAIVYAAQVNTKVQQGDMDAARVASNNAKMWCWIAFAAGIVTTFISVAITILSGLHNLR